MNPDVVFTDISLDIVQQIESDKPRTHFISSIKPPLHIVEGWEVNYMDMATYEMNLLSNKIPIFTAAQLEEAKYGPPFRSRPSFDVYIGKRPMVYPEISYGDRLPPAGSHYLLVTYTLPLDVNCASCEKPATFNNIETAIACDPQSSTSIIITPELPMPSIDTAALLRRGLTVTPVFNMQRQAVKHPGKPMHVLKQTELATFRHSPRTASTNVPRIPPLTIRLSNAIRFSGTRPPQAAPVKVLRPFEKTMTFLEFTCDFCGVIRSNKSLISEHIRKCTTRLRQRDEALARQTKKGKYSTPNPFEILLFNMRNSV